MKNTICTLFLCGLMMSCGVTKQGVLVKKEKQEYKILTVAFYNLENLFDTVNDPTKYDERSPIMEMPVSKRETVYQKKLHNMAFVLSQIGVEKTNNLPVVIGVCEAENRKVLEDLVRQPDLKSGRYGVIHYKGPDERSIDVALLYQKDLFRPISSSAHKVMLYRDGNRKKRDYTRDQLLVTGLLDGEKVHFIVNHWPSRSGGQKASESKRLAAAAVMEGIIDSLQTIDPYAKIIAMGDFNDNPYDKSINQVLEAKGSQAEVGLKGLYNPYLKLYEKGIGTGAYRDGWDLFDQMILSKPFLKNDYSSYRLYKAYVFNPHFLLTPKGEYRGYPYRSYSDGKFTNGYSDHFPVYLYLIKRSGVFFGNKIDKG